MAKKLVVQVDEEVRRELSSFFMKLKTVVVEYEGVEPRGQVPVDSEID